MLGHYLAIQSSGNCGARWQTLDNLFDIIDNSKVVNAER